MNSSWPVLSTLIFFPLAASVLLVFIRRELAVRQVSLAVAFVQILLALPLLKFRLGYADFQFVELYSWIPHWNINYHIGIDGISFLMVLLTVLLLPFCVLCSWTYIGQRVKEFHICMLLMTAACIGVFVALDFVLFYIFWEVMLVPMFLLIAVWGGPEKKYASLKFFIYTLAGSTLLLVAIVAFYVAGGTFSIPELIAKDFSFRFQAWTFLAMALAFAIKVPMFPFHTWLPAAHVQAPTAGSVLLASVLLKMGTYGFIRFCLSMTPDASVYFAPLMIGISIASIIYGGLVALGQNDMKKLIAYSSVAHMGFVTLGIFVLNVRGLEGAVIQMINHGITTGALFMLVGAIYERSHSREIKDNMGIARFLPAYIFFFGLFSLSSLAFPGTNSFVGEALVLIGAFEHSLIIGLLAVPGALLAAAYMLRLLQKLAYGEPVVEKARQWKDLNFREWAYLLPLGVLVLYIGLAPTLALKTMTPSIEKVLGYIQASNDNITLEAEHQTSLAGLLEEKNLSLKE
ncbi:complex I subunit 4 family protein [Desulfonatronovibrio hydrogenovorans]|uniref:complex I subunit 4 family protein n=1 Tax=Desulfonatronovibrio hydrogenovorans TaxID=53245 RepID=UPI00048EFA1D|nr:NADH-quinone oxidoreductase subunit M [Desulfonatronovibrio hydrogenovorans]